MNTILASIWQHCCIDSVTKLTNYHVKKKRKSISPAIYSGKQTGDWLQPCSALISWVPLQSPTTGKTCQGGKSLCWPPLPCLLNCLFACHSVSYCKTIQIQFNLGCNVNVWVIKKDSGEHRNGMRGKTEKCLCTCFPFAVFRSAAHGVSANYWFYSRRATGSMISKLYTNWSASS